MIKFEDSLQIRSASLLKGIVSRTSVPALIKFEENMENWKKIKNYPEYEISDYGRVRSFKNGRYGLKRKPKILKISIWGGYYHSRVNFNNKSIHRLVLEHFGPPQPSKKHECCHNDGNKLNNHIDNLRWGTRKENIQDSIKHGIWCRGSKNGQAKLKEQDIPNIKQLKKNGATQKELAAIYKVSQTAIWKIINNKKWTYA